MLRNKNAEHSIEDITTLAAGAVASAKARRAQALDVSELEAVTGGAAAATLGSVLNDPILIYGFYPYPTVDKLGLPQILA